MLLTQHRPSKATVIPAKAGIQAFQQGNVESLQVTKVPLSSTALAGERGLGSGPPLPEVTRSLKFRSRILMPFKIINNFTYGQAPLYF